MDKIKILKVEPGKPPCVKEIANDFKASQEEVEGDIECVGFGCLLYTSPSPRD